MTTTEQPVIDNLPPHPGPEPYEAAAKAERAKIEAASVAWRAKLNASEAAATEAYRAKKRAARDARAKVANQLSKADAVDLAAALQMKLQEGHGKVETACKKCFSVWEQYAGDEYRSNRTGT